MGGKQEGHGGVQGPPSGLSTVPVWGWSRLCLQHSLPATLRTASGVSAAELLCHPGTQVDSAVLGERERTCVLPGVRDFQGRGRGLYPGGVGPTGLPPEGPVPGCDAGKLPEPSLPG